MNYWVFLFAGDGVLFAKENFSTAEAVENYLQNRQDFTGTPLVIKGDALAVERTFKVVEPTEK